MGWGGDQLCDSLCQKEAMKCQCCVLLHIVQVRTDEIQWHNVGQIPSQQENIKDRRLEKSEQKG